MTDEADRLPAVLQVLADSDLISADEIEALQGIDPSTSQLQLRSETNRIGATLPVAHAKPDILAVCARVGLVGLVCAVIDSQVKDELAVSFAFHVTPEMLEPYAAETPAAATVNAADFGNLPPGVAAALAVLAKNQEVQAQQMNAIATALQAKSDARALMGERLIEKVMGVTFQQFDSFAETHKQTDPAEAMKNAGETFLKTVAAVGEIQKQVQAVAPKSEPVGESDLATAVAVLGKIVGPGGQPLSAFFAALKNAGGAPGAGAQPTAHDYATAGVTPEPDPEPEPEPDQDQDAVSTDGMFKATVKMRTVDTVEVKAESA